MSPALRPAQLCAATLDTAAYTERCTAFLASARCGAPFRAVLHHSPAVVSLHPSAGTFYLAEGLVTRIPIAPGRVLRWKGAHVDSLVVITHPQPLRLEARHLEHDTTPPGSTALAYYHDERLVARGIVSDDAVAAIRSLLRAPVALALAATEDDEHNIDARVCLVLPVDPDEFERYIEDDEDEPDEPWKASVPPPAYETEGSDAGDGDGQARLALLPIGNVVRGARDRHHEDVAGDAREMLDNLVAGRAKGAVDKAIDDLLDNL